LRILGLIGLNAVFQKKRKEAWHFWEDLFLPFPETNNIDEIVCTAIHCSGTFIGTRGNVHK